MDFALLFEGARRSVLLLYVSTLRRENDVKGAELTRPPIASHIDYQPDIHYDMTYVRETTGTS